MKTIFTTKLLTLALLCSTVTPAALGMDDELRRAVQKEDIPRLHELLTAGAEINAADQEGRTPLHLAARARKGESIQALLEAGACITIRDHDGNTPLHLAVIGSQWWADLDEDGIRLMQRMLPAMAGTAIGDFQTAHDAIAAAADPLLQRLRAMVDRPYETLGRLATLLEGAQQQAGGVANDMIRASNLAVTQTVARHGTMLQRVQRLLAEQRPLHELLPERIRQRIETLPRFAVNRIMRPFEQLRHQLIDIAHAYELVCSPQGNQELLAQRIDHALGLTRQLVAQIPHLLRHAPRLAQLTQEYVLDIIMHGIHTLQQAQQALPAGPQALADGASQQLMDALPEKYQAALPAYQRLQQMTQPLAALPAAAGNPMLQATQALLPLLNVADPITPMLMAAWTEHCVKAPAVVQLLLDAGAEPAVVNHAGRWPEEEAEQFGFYNLAQQLQHVRQAHRQREARALYCTLIQKQNRDEEFDSSATLAGRVAEFIVDDNPAEQLLHIDAHMLRRHELDQMNPVHRQLVLLRERAAARLSRTWQQAKSSVQELLRKKR